MAKLSTETRDKLPGSKFAGPNRSFPLTDKTHDREAISGATRSEHAGNISESTADHIKAEARAKLHDGKGGDPPADHKAAVAKMHPEHLNKLVQDAHAGKYGPEAQKTAQSAMQQGGAPQEGDGDGDADQQPNTPKPNYSSIFAGSGGDDEEDETAPVPAGQMFAGSRGR